MNYDIFADEKKTEHTVIEDDSKKVLDLPVEDTNAPSSHEEDDNEDPDESSEESPAEESEPAKDKEVIEVDKDFPKKDLGVGGASFIDEFLRVATDDQMAMLKRGERTLSGFWNWSYSKVKAEYVKACGRVNGGVFSDVGVLASEYFSEAIKEGTIVECDEYKVKKPTTAKKETKTTKRKNVKKIVEKIAKKASDDAKKDNEKVIEKIKERIDFLSGNAKIVEPVKSTGSSKRKFSSIFKS